MNESNARDGAQRARENFAVVVVGAGQAGLAAGYWLSRARVRFTLIDAAETAGASWRNRWDTLRLFTPARYDALPGLRFPGPDAALPTKDEVASYLETYARTFELPIRFGTRARTLRRDAHGFTIVTDRGELAADAVIVATGANQRPHVPSLAANLAPGIVQLHAQEYRRPDQLPSGRILVVGAGNSGAQIALDLAATGREVILSGRDTGRIPRRWLGRDIYDWLWPTIMRASIESRVGRRMMRDRLFAGDPLVGIAPGELERAGVVRVGRCIAVEKGELQCEGDTRVPSVSGIVWCTGFRPDYGWIELPALGLDGYPRHRRGIANDVPGLGFLGMRFQHRMSSALLGGVGEDAEYVVDRLLADHRGRGRE